MNAGTNDRSSPARGGIPNSKRRLRERIRRLNELRATDAEELAQLKADVEALVGARLQAHAQAEEHRLREAVSAGGR
ncbi:hypothetical protein SAM23877_7399 [Streptomyces ambofaciens ATCC 23877]|uniref:Uncharacterized protein n=1 Tax=Streptomyces ambofaciens (strain ATCC 23877 / 3486 / DSM 40053 / JCM 4204 / NBRC 12836 / NRRL B-2516) TaxID=278992 RepID=A0A0K2B4W2_STRA7|nr:hypothetical protein SAM23877_7399 [Streptomyces ambofaciens ATCC 23877]